MKFYLSIILILYFLVGCVQPNSETQTNATETNGTDAIVGGYFDISTIKDDVLCVSYPENMNKAIIISKIDELFYFEQLNIMKTEHLLEYCNTNKDQFYDYALKSIKKYNDGGYVFNGEFLKINNIRDNEINITINNNEFIGNITTCTSLEGEHLNVWNKGSMSERLIYAYRYLGLDLTESCQDKEYYDSLLQ